MCCGGEHRGEYAKQRQPEDNRCHQATRGTGAALHAALYAGAERQAGREAGAAAARHRERVVVTHDGRVYDFADRIVSMSDGRIENVEDFVRTDRVSKIEEH